MQLPIREIIVKNRVRQNLGDLSGLKDSITEHGIMNPIVINARKELIAGHRRLESARSLGWTMVPVRVIEDVSEIAKLQMEIDENLHRKALSPEELAEAYDLLERMSSPGFFTRIWRAIARFFARIFRRGNPSGGRTGPKGA